MAYTFTPSDCMNCSESLKNNVKTLISIIDDVGDTMDLVKNNYDSESSRRIIALVAKLKEQAPDFTNAIDECAKYLVEEVAPSYAAVERLAEIIPETNSVG